MNRKLPGILASALLAVLFAAGDAVGATYNTINLQTNDLAYSSVSGMLYVSVPDASTTNPDSLTPINPSTAALGAPLAVGFNPQNVVVSTDGTTIYTVLGGNLGVQPIALPSQTFGTPFFITGGPTVSQILAIPGQPNAVLVATRQLGYSNSTSVWQNSMHLPDQVGSGAGTGGPDIIAVDRLNGTNAYGYDNSDTGYTNFVMKITSTGVNGANGPNLQGILTGFNVGRIDLMGNNLFTDRGEVFSLSPAIQVGAFQGGGNFVLDPAGNKLFSITTSGSTQTIHAYSLSNFQQLETDTITGLPGNTSKLVRFGTDGLAFRTSNNQVAIVHSGIVAPTILGDMNRDGQLTAADVPAMISALTNLNAYKTAHNMSDIQLRAVGDVNGDYNPATLTGGVNNEDLQALLNLLKGSTMTSVPEPAAIWTISIALAALVLFRITRFDNSHPRFTLAMRGFCFRRFSGGDNLARPTGRERI
jgi:hypothetical protein